MLKQSTRSRWRSATRKALAVVVALALTVGALPSALVQPAPVLAAGNCATSSPPSAAYAIELCFTSITDGETVTGDRTVTVSRTTVSGSAPLYNSLVYSLDDPNDPNDAPYLLTAFAAPYSFVLPSARFFKDGTYHLSVIAEMRDLNVLQGPTITVNFANGVTTPQGSGNSFAEVNGPASGPVVLAAVGDGPDGGLNAMKVANLIDSWNPDMFLYLGDVYDKGTPTEYHNWYRPGSALGRFRAITNPVIGNHEYENGGAPGYFDYWGANTPHYYSVDAGGWHIISLDSTFQFNQTAPGSDQYTWLENDLSSNTAACTIAFFHHPVFNVGEEADGQVFKSTLADIWSLLDQHDVDIALTGHDHDYQRWQPLNGAGTVDPDGITEFVVGTGGHGIQQFQLSDPRLAAGVDSNGAFGALRLVLNQEGAAYRFVTVDGAVRDSGSVACDATVPDAAPPTEPTNLTASPVSGTQRVDLDWNASSDNVGVTGYDVYRDGAKVATTGPVSDYSDTGVVAGVTHTYQVRAWDAAGNVSDASNTAIVNASSQFFQFSDDFESGNLSRWTSGNLAVQQQVAESGVWAAQAKPADTTQAAQARKTLSTAQSDLYSRTKFKVVALDPTKDVTLLQLRTGASNAASILRLYVTPAGKLAYRNDGGTNNVAAKTSTTTVVPGQWHEVQIRTRVNTANPEQGQVEIWYDGNLVPDLTLTRNLGSAKIGRLQLGEALTGKTYDIVFDDVAADTNPIPYGWSASPDTTPPSAPVLTLSESGPDEHAAGTTLFYNPTFGNSGAFTVEATTADPDSGIARVEFPEVFGADADIDTTSPYVATYTWGDTSTTTGPLTVTSTNGSGLTATSTFTVTPDSTGPAAFALTAPADGVTIQNGQPVSAAPTDADSGIAQVEFRYCAGASCDWNFSSGIGANDITAPYTMTWTNLPAEGQYTLLARATDNVGNTTESAPVTVTVSSSATPTPTATATPPPPTTLTLAPVADADVNESSPNTNYGTNALLRLDGATDPDREGYLRFDVSGVTGAVQSVKLRLYSPNGTDNGPELYPVSDTTWGETTIKWSNKPPRGTTRLADLAKITTNTWVEYDLGAAAVPGNGAYSFVLVPQSTDGVDFHSRENATNPPQLVLTVDESSSVTVLSEPTAATITAAATTVTLTPTDTTPPSAPVLTLTETIPEAHVAGSTLYYNPGVGSTSNVTVEASTVDAESGIKQVAFPALFGSAVVNDLESPYSTSYNWSAGASASGAHSVTATNGVDLTATSTFTVTPDSAAPTVTITNPADGAMVQNGQVVSATPADVGSGVAQVEFRYCDSVTCTPIGTASSAPYEVTWSDQPADGSYTLLARATDQVGNTTDSTSLTVTVSNSGSPETTAPSVAITAPVAGATVSNGVSLSADASDADSGVARVEFFYCPDSSCDEAARMVIDAADTTAPYGVTWSNQPADGSYTLLARATDNVGNTTDSETVTVSVSNAVTPTTTPEPSATPDPTATATPSATPDLTATPSPTATLEPSATPTDTTPPSAPVLTASGTELSSSTLMSIPEASPTPEATEPSMLMDTVTTASEATETAMLEASPTPAVTEVPIESLDGETTPSGTGTASTKRTRVEAATVPPTPTPTPIATPEVTPTPDETDERAGGTTRQEQTDPGDGDVVLGETASRDDGARDAPAEVSSDATTAGETDESAGSPKRQQRTERGDGEPADPGDGEPRDRAAPNPAESRPAEQPLEEQPLPAASGRDRAGTPRDESAAPPGLAGETAGAEPVSAADGDPPERRNDARRDLEAGDHPAPEARPDDATAALAPPDEGPVRGDRRGRDTRSRATKASAPDDPEGGERAATLRDTRGTGPRPRRDPEESPTPPESPPADITGGSAAAPQGTGDGAARDGARPDVDDGMSQSGSRGRQGKKPGRQTTDGSRSQGRANGPKDRKDATQAQEDQDASTAYRIVKTRQSGNAVDAAVVADDDPATVWTTKPGTTPDEAWVVLDLGTPRTVGSVRWRVAADGLVGALRIEVSTDGKRWKKAAGGEQDAAKGDQEAAKGWQELDLKPARTARYVRLVFTNAAGAPRLGGLAEVEVWPAATSEAKGSGAHEDRPRGTADRQRGTSGQAKAKPKQAQAKSGRERAKSGKQHNESKNQQGSTEPPQEPPPGDTDPPTGADAPQGTMQEPTQDQATSNQKRNPEQKQGKERSTGPERKKDKAKSTHKRVHRSRGR